MRWFFFAKIVHGVKALTFFGKEAPSEMFAASIHASKVLSPSVLMSFLDFNWKNATMSFFQLLALLLWTNLVSFFKVEWIVVGCGVGLPYISLKSNSFIKLKSVLKVAWFCFSWKRLKQFVFLRFNQHLSC